MFANKTKLKLLHRCCRCCVFRLFCDFKDLYYKMRITLHLEHFFSDHRSIARILISDKMKKIEDVENRVSSIFGISDFYLTSDDIYLPTAESVAVLNNNEIVWYVKNPLIYYFI